jgi:hypothetical protein
MTLPIVLLRELHDKIGSRSLFVLFRAPVESQACKSLITIHNRAIDVDSTLSRSLYVLCRVSIGSPSQAHRIVSGSHRFLPTPPIGVRLWPRLPPRGGDDQPLPRRSSPFKTNSYANYHELCADAYLTSRYDMDAWLAPAPRRPGDAAGYRHSGSPVGPPHVLLSQAPKNARVLCAYSIQVSTFGRVAPPWRTTKSGRPIVFPTVSDAAGSRFGSVGSSGHAVEGPVRRFRHGSDLAGLPSRDDPAACAAIIPARGGAAGVAGPTSPIFGGDWPSQVSIVSVSRPASPRSPSIPMVPGRATGYVYLVSEPEGSLPCLS